MLSQDENNGYKDIKFEKDGRVFTSEGTLRVSQFSGYKDIIVNVPTLNERQLLMTNKVTDVILDSSGKSLLSKALV